MGLINTASNANGGTLVERALFYAQQLKWPVIPLHTPDDSGACSCRNADCSNVGKHPRTLHGLTDASTDPELIKKWWRMFPDANIGVVTGQSSGIVVIDVDPRHGGDESFRSLEQEHGAIPPTITALTGGRGRHLVFKHPGRRIGNVQVDRNGRGKLGPGLDVRADGGYFVAPPSRHQSGSCYSWRDQEGQLASLPPWLLVILSDEKTAGTLSSDSGTQTIERGRRNVTLTSFAGSMRTRGLTQEEIAPALLALNSRRCVPPLSDDEVIAIAKSVQRYESSPEFAVYIGSSIQKQKHPVTRDQQMRTPSVPFEWPQLDPKALYGLAGEFVGKVEPHSEADPVALLAQFLIIFGNVVGRSARFDVEADHHYMNLFGILVGLTSAGRKGTAWGQALRPFKMVDEAWADSCIVGGLSSGEGLIWAVRDPIEQTRPIRENGRATGEYETVIIDQGILDKRELVFESEFASVLSVQGRDGSTLSAVVRQAWDNGNLRVLTKNSPARATDAHISIVGHITADELGRCLDQVDAFNGYFNRFLWFCVKRSKFLPEGGQSADIDFNPLVVRLAAAIDYARGVEQMSRDDEARELWRREYVKLAEGKGGFHGAITARGVAQVTRLSCIYALLDCSEIVRRIHLEAALALWRYSSDSALYLFADRSGDKVTSEILRALSDSNTGLTRTEMSNLFGRNLKADRISKALTALEGAGVAIKTIESREGAIRPVERWFRTSNSQNDEQYEINEFDAEHSDQLVS